MAGDLLGYGVKSADACDQFGIYASIFRRTHTRATHRASNHAIDSQKYRLFRFIRFMSKLELAAVGEVPDAMAGSSPMSP
jgi:hypothetical protein